MIMGVQTMFNSFSKSNFKTIFKTTITVVGMFALSTVTAKSLPQEMFACHVSTAAVFDGLVMMQANNKEDAIKGALSTKALTTNDTRAKTTAVIECINRTGEQRFSDIQFQAFYESLSEEFK